MISVYNHTHLTSEVIHAITNEVAHINSLERLLAHHGAEKIVNMVSQDEFTVDVMVKYAESIYLVYDST